MSTILSWQVRRDRLESWGELTVWSLAELYESGHVKRHSRLRDVRNVRNVVDRSCSTRHQSLRLKSRRWSSHSCSTGNGPAWL